MNKLLVFALFAAICIVFSSAAPMEELEDAPEPSPRVARAAACKDRDCSLDCIFKGYRTGRCRNGRCVCG
ncbi:defense protein 6-like [Agrilus planipennis]|uniref:Defense protein 6-like n=1 Tax=Agrilus planipennis TaxID=224129 RepID=A0A1W4WJ82_AGRPL|nr:defense protein 6-like [Agrilus planipennis]